MIPGFIFAISFLALLQFFVIYCRSLIVASRGQRLSEQAREICGVVGYGTSTGQFKRLLQLIALCPPPGGEGFEVQAVALYFGMLGLARTLLSDAIPSASPWIEAERGGCAYVAAVMLDRRISYGRTMMAKLASR